MTMRERGQGELEKVFCIDEAASLSQLMHGLFLMIKLLIAKK